MICTHLHITRCNIPVLLLYQKHQQYTGHFETYHGEKVFTVRVRMLDDQTGVLLYRSKHFNINSHDIANCSVDLESGTFKRPCVTEISEHRDDLQVNNWLFFKYLS